jgi:hypothetical protein
VARGSLSASMAVPEHWVLGSSADKISIPPLEPFRGVKCHVKLFGDLPVSDLKVNELAAISDGMCQALKLEVCTSEMKHRPDEDQRFMPVGYRVPSLIFGEI